MSISDNVERKKIIKTLQDEISILQNELLDVRRRNMALESRVKKMERENSRLGGAVSCFLLLGLLRTDASFISMPYTTPELTL